MDSNIHQNNRAIWVYAQKLRLLLQSGIIDEKAYLGILEIAKKQLNTTLVLP